VPKRRPVESVFLNIPYDKGFEDLYLAYIVGLSQLGFRLNVTLAVPNQGRLDTIIELIEKSDLFHSKRGKDKHRVYIFDAKPYRAQRSTSDVNGIDPQVHNGSPKNLMVGLRNIFRQPGDVTTVPEMLASYRALQKQLSNIRKRAGGGSLFGAAIFQDIVLASLIEAQHQVEKRRNL
jgi:hypothetical protein